jgi:3-isopropylmalate/(R)-2-methylmalate dehydratase small subunit
MRFNGTAHRFGDHVDTDQIIPGRYLTSSDPAVLAKHAMEGALPPGFADRVTPGDVIVAGVNFGCGSSREHAPLALKGAGVACVVAESFARIFFRNAINIGLPIIECPAGVDWIADGDNVVVDVRAGTIVDTANQQQRPVAPFDDFIVELLDAGGLVPYARKQLAAKGALS